MVRVVWEGRVIINSASNPDCGSEHEQDGEEKEGGLGSFGRFNRDLEEGRREGNEKWQQV